MWKRQYISKGGRLTLVKSMLASLPIYFMSLFRMPRRVRLRLGKIQRDFLWGDGALESKPHVVKWDIVCLDKGKGGLGLAQKRLEWWICGCTLLRGVDGTRVSLDLSMTESLGRWSASCQGFKRRWWLRRGRMRSNFQFIWPWEEWAYVLDLPKWAPQRVFVQEVLEREVRLSYWDKVKQGSLVGQGEPGKCGPSKWHMVLCLNPTTDDTLNLTGAGCCGVSIENAPTLEELLPPKGGPSFKYSTEDGKERNEQHALSMELSSMVKGRQVSREVITWIEESVIPVHGSEVALSVVVQTLLDIGSKSFTHLITVLERYGQVIAKLCHDQDKQVVLIDEVSSYWKNSAQMTAIAIDRMMGYRLISNFAIVKWVFSSENIEQFHTSDHPWEILRNAVSKTYNRISDLRKEISSLKKSLALAEGDAVTRKAELEAAESKLTLVDGEPVLGENPVRLKRLKSYAEKAKEEEVSVRDSLEAKEALLARALDENEALFLSLYKNFSNVLMERLPDTSQAGTLRGLKTIQADEMAVDLEESSTMDVDNENGRPQKSQTNGGKANNGYNVGEKEQWCLSTLGYVKAFSRQYASEIWLHIEKLDAEVLTEDVHPLFRKAVYAGLRRPINEG
ncbi:Nuclear cap-binding protein subunit 1 [Vitis vinifera]|uniref:Nuclear cap-binding protein subunit 1 n=1 Tax=Vitis vinifera TaxID=29760 RepID=A0A438F2I9_VITVI|nr:Nuclear cap-binding protein subunit 1 [Vitis vinifera]